MKEKSRQILQDIREKIPEAESIFIRARLLKFALELHPESNEGLCVGDAGLQPLFVFECLY